MRRLSSTAGWFGRRWPLLFVCPVLAIAAAVVLTGPGTTSYTSTTVVVINAGETTKAPGSSVEATMLATTYAKLLHDDDGLTTYVARKAGVDPQHVRDSIQVIQLTGTALLKISFTEDDKADALAESAAVVDAVQSSASVSAAIPPKVMRVVRASELTSSSGTSPVALTALAAVFGVLLGLGLSLLLERMDVRVDNRRAASDLLGCPVREWPADQSVGTLLAMVSRWAELAAGPDGRENSLARMARRDVSASRALPRSRCPRQRSMPTCPPRTSAARPRGSDAARAYRCCA